MGMLTSTASITISIVSIIYHHVPTVSCRESIGMMLFYIPDTLSDTHFKQLFCSLNLQYNTPEEPLCKTPTEFNSLP